MSHHEIPVAGPVAGPRVGRWLHALQSYHLGRAELNADVQAHRRWHGEVLKARTTGRVGAEPAGPGG